MSGNKILTQSKGHNNSTNVPKISCDNRNVDLANINTYIKFGETLSISSKDIGRKRNFGINQRP